MSHKAPGRKKKKIKVVFLWWFVIISNFKKLPLSYPLMYSFFFYEQDTLTAEQIAGKSFFFLIRYDHWKFRKWASFVVILVQRSKNTIKHRSNNLFYCPAVDQCKKWHKRHKIKTNLSKPIKLFYKYQTVLMSNVSIL